VRVIRVRLDDEHDIVACAVIIASGVRYRRLDVPGLADLEGRGVYYAASELEAKVVSGQNAVVVGGANSAGQAALFLARHAGQVHVLIRRDDLRDTMSATWRSASFTTNGSPSTLAGSCPRSMARAV
jgi:thioredoxin reductase (NADPH)